ncbi:MAG TPA: prenyltransferase, partial [bacterium]
LTWEIIYCSIPPGLLTAQLLFLNEFPDAEADRAGGRRHLVIRLGKRKSAALYAAGMILVYVLIAIAPWAAGSPRTVWLALIPLPTAAAAAVIALKHDDDFGDMVLAQGLNAMTVLSTDILLAVGYFLTPYNPSR